MMRENISFLFFSFLQEAIDLSILLYLSFAL